jgi:hypothetical protein
MARRRKPIDDIPVHLKFGYEAVMEKRAIRKRLLDAGCPDDMLLFFRIEREYEEAHKNDLPFRERQKAWLARQPKAPERIVFTQEELDNIID